MKKADKIAHFEPNKAPLRKIYLVIGMTSVAREDLENILKLGKRYSVYGFGVCYFSSDISEDLIHSAVEKFRLIGIVKASKVVKDALTNK